MFNLYLIFVLALIALSLGGFLVVLAKAHKEVLTGFSAIVGYVVIILSIIILLSSGYSMVRSCIMKKRLLNMMQQFKTMPKQQMKGSDKMSMQGPHHQQMQKSMNHQRGM